MERWDIVDYQGTQVILLEKMEESSLWKVYPTNHMKDEIQIVKETELSPTIAEYQIPVTWECYGTVTVTADSIKEAIRIFDREKDEYPLPDDSGYVDDSLMRESYGSLDAEKGVYAFRQLPFEVLSQIKI